jgi:hypothetical protein
VISRLARLEVNLCLETKVLWLCLDDTEASCIVSSEREKTKKKKKKEYEMTYVLVFPIPPFHP